ncbi:Peptidylprolyl isomerase (Cyclophilin)-like 2,related [Neospora caninum Liverpool]|uniref:Peptidylprolyl isomerase (Cyclophilin)-like 2,related n=1 Tax=Neospora caninum (strain Liverpool) TaxID=572307 RepID=F0VDZ0_NEOCL|nr:Peptidylprolyl isomerase (Cyclophilin)-like 2,related [Neospora caninum Liverpool]CBZ51933.1 Peptidylprolyl isomerase (Cyclophilin)-like 2,related [Neospora caninum Liverpool]CEL65895.1 TPA: Peptidylprolyl isomerase (Cyclophilin)-like 2,related [Neospora caninum Liverpool]|eukprot:XP_003881966.1 Peptidylprolyl isomerase (Cyclophilin)-like 2,related [Neospora caninum Liverpool]
MSEVYVHEPSTRGKVVLHTSLGDLDVELWARECPIACRNFVQLCLEGYYANTIFHRVVKDFIVQGGDPTGTGRGGADTTFDGKPFDVETHPRLKFRYRGLFGVANLGRSKENEKDERGRSLGTNGNQFFITLARADVLNNAYTLFGKISGHTLYNLMKFNDLEVGKEDRPLNPPFIKSVDVLWNPFDDIVPRRLPDLPGAKDAAERDRRKRARDVRTPGGRLSGADGKELDEEVEAREKLRKADKKLLSFGDEDGDTHASDTGKKLSAHDLLDDPHLLRDAPHTDEREEREDEEEEQEWSAERRSRGARTNTVAGVRARLAALSSRGGEHAPEGTWSERRGRRSREEGSSPSPDSDSEEEAERSSRGRRRDSEKPDDRRHVEALRLRSGVGSALRGSHADREKMENSDLMTEAEKRRQLFLLKKKDKGDKKRQEATMQKLDLFTAQLRRLRAPAAASPLGTAEPASNRVSPAASPRHSSRAGEDKRSKGEAGTLNALLPDLDEEVDESDGSWLNTGGLKFAVDSARAYELDEARAAASVVVFDPLKGLSDEVKRKRAENRRREQGRINENGMRDVPKW